VLKVCPAAFRIAGVRRVPPVIHPCHGQDAVAPATGFRPYVTTTYASEPISNFAPTTAAMSASC